MSQQTHDRQSMFNNPSDFGSAVEKERIGGVCQDVEMKENENVNNIQIENDNTKEVGQTELEKQRQKKTN